MDLEGRLELLRDVAAFRGLADAALRDVAARAVPREFAVGEVLCRQGDPADGLWVFASGEVDVLLHRRGSVDRIAAGGHGVVMGEMALVTHSTRIADVVATEAGQALFLSAADFRELETQRPEVLAVLTEIAAARLGQAALDGLGDKVLDHYRLLRPVGRGASSIVYEAAEIATERPVALKMLSHRFARDRAAMQWFEKEAALLAKLDHPSVARCHGSFDAYGTRFLVIDFVDGPTVADVIRHVRPVPDDDVRRIGGAVAAALSYVHDRGVVHGDVKPANVLLARTGRVRLTDFGIASEVPSDPAARSDQIRVHGTPRYMAPEMFVGAPPSPLTDLYALGCLLWEMATGRCAFDDAGIGPLVLAKRTFKLPPAGAIREGIAEDLHAAIGGLLEPDPAHRWQHAKTLAVAAGDVSGPVVATAIAGRMRTMGPDQSAEPSTRPRL